MIETMGEVNWMEAVDKLKSILKNRLDLKEGLQISISRAGIDGVRNIDDYYSFLLNLLSQIPVRRTMGQLAGEFHYLISQSPDSILKNDQSFREWLVYFSQNMGAFLDTIQSASHLDTFINDPDYHISDYEPGPSGWLTFNQFFARPVKPGKRPIAEICNTSVIVSSADSTFLGTWPVSREATVNAKGVTYFISDLLAGSKYQDRFKGGVFTHSYLDSNDYHRFHVPAAGKIVESGKIAGDVIVNAVRNNKGEITVQDEVGFQFTQTRGLIILETPFGLVAALPIGMGHVSSVTITAEVGAELHKGQEFGYFSYGGSDMVLLFESSKFEFIAQEQKHYKQGEAIARLLE
jgi:phosphatidylserine decarboxylase